jgi:hypothetical protein
MLLPHQRLKLALDAQRRSEAIRRLIEFALAVKAKRQNTDDK